MKVVFCVRQFRKEMYSKSPQNFTLNHKICIKQLFFFLLLKIDVFPGRLEESLPGFPQVKLSGQRHTAEDGSSQSHYSKRDRKERGTKCFSFFFCCFHFGREATRVKGKHGKTMHGVGNPQIINKNIC